MLSSCHRISGQEDIIEQYTEETQLFREKNEKLKQEVGMNVIMFTDKINIVAAASSPNCTAIEVVVEIETVLMIPVLIL